MAPHASGHVMATRLSHKSKDSGYFADTKVNMTHRPYAQHDKEPLASNQETATATNPSRPFEFVADVPMDVSVQFGSATITLHRLLTLAPGSVIELQSQPGDSVSIVANGKSIARGEVVVVNDRYGVRITEI
jgi:flagellar motor switch protein FliN/FliY